MGEDVVTAVRADRRGATMVVNGELTLWVGRDAWLERELQEGETFDLAEYGQWLLPRQYPEALNAAVAFLAVRARSAKEVRRKLEQKHYLAEAVDMALYKLEKERLIDDEVFAREWAAACAHRRMGRQRILRELWAKGIDGDLAERAVDELSGEDMDAAAVAAAEKLLRRYAGEPDAKKAMGKLMAAMQRRGYAYDEASAAIAAALVNARESE